MLGCLATLGSGFKFQVARFTFLPATLRHIKTETSPQNPELKVPVDLSRWKRFRYRIEEAGCLFLKWFIPRLSRLSCMKLGILFGDLAYFIDGRGRAVAFSNLECAFGDQYTERQRRWIARLSYRNFVRTMFDLFWAPPLVGGGYKKYMQHSGFRELRERMDREKRGAVFMCIHEGNWEWASLTGGVMGFYNFTVTEEFKNPRLNAIFSGLRELSGQTMIPQENSILRMLKIIKRGGSTGILIDLNLRPSQAATVIEGFGMKMCVPVMHAILAQRVNAILCPAETEPHNDGTCRVTVYPNVDFPPDASLQQIAQQCWDHFEPFLRRRPDLWLWPYKHFRYKPKDATRPYPEYARESSKFEKLMRSLQ